MTMINQKGQEKGNDLKIHGDNRNVDIYVVLNCEFSCQCK